MGNLQTSLLSYDYCCCGLDCVFKSYKYQSTHVVYNFRQGNELNIAFPFVILILQNCIQKNKVYHGIWNMFTVLGTKSNNVCWRAAQKDCTCATRIPQ